ncbi:uncharacterized protein LOC130716300 [Lotus japonicus]|uniref:uncharacterized protein LOC130716300 n=1 Tax=Lotus japonicus TaxID=34305 RepID=UPI00258B08D6|nr:uncharacterized protein LOC130716300 [Lotus japonicus]
MACRRMLRYSTILTEPLLLCPSNLNFNHHYHIHIASRKCNNLKSITIKPRQFHSPKPPIACSSIETTPHHDADDQDPPQETVLKAISEVSKSEGRVGGGTVADDSTKEWMALDQKVNTYPTVRGFTAIGTGGQDFVQAMLVAVESVIQQPIPQGQVKQKLSSGGKYVSVNIGPIEVVSFEQVQAVYNAMRRDGRIKYFL